MALRIVYEVAQVVSIPIVAIGGVTSLDDVLDFLACGAVAVQVGTAIFADPELPVRLVDELRADCVRRGLDLPAAGRDRAAEATGARLRQGRGVPTVNTGHSCRAGRTPDDDNPSAAELAAARAIAARTEELFRRSGALEEGHFLLKSGKHSERYLEKFLVLQDPAATSELCGFWAARLRGADGPPMVDVVAGPTTGGIVLAFETARQLGVRGIFAEEVRTPTGRRAASSGAASRSRRGERVLLVDDILTTGGSLLAMLPAVEAFGGEIVACAVLADRSGGLASLTSPTTRRSYPLRALWQLQLPTYEPGPETCPACAAGLPLHAPGSTGSADGRARARPAPRAAAGPDAGSGGVESTVRSPAWMAMARRAATHCQTSLLDQSGSPSPA